MDFIKRKNFSMKNTIKTMEKATDGEKTFAGRTPDRGFVSKAQEERLRLNK